jgi:hypothetical protein
VRRTLGVVVLLAVSACGSTDAASVRTSSTDVPGPELSCAAESMEHDDGIHLM